jgi:hypothetical protein
LLREGEGRSAGDENLLNNKEKHIITLSHRYRENI